ncbi:MAG: MiaB/RimO family radical SAM methylthiotransferase [Planctomycetota bacterium]|jgi:tRNA-2-methylthio-N6-dimethylallyladenosine synthase
MSVDPTPVELTSTADASRGPAIYLETFGCQMNELDSELVRGSLTALGYRMTQEQGEADVILYNTCSVREQAENKVLSRVGRVGIHKDEGRDVVLGLIGCLAEREGAGLISRYPQIDLLCGPGELDRLPMLIDNVLKSGAAPIPERISLQGNRSRRSSTLAAADDQLEMLDLSRAFDPEGGAAGGRTAYVRITRGCNKFCTYCVVPNTRGAEVHRPPDAIVDECRRLAAQGVMEVTLLGQTVNHYIYVHGEAVGEDGRELAQVGPGAAAFTPAGRASLAAGRRVTTFAELLGRIHDEVPEIQRLRFVTSYPRDFGDDILDVMASSPRICRYLHVPAQSGSNDVLKRMNRGYTVEQYLEFVDRVLDRLPDVCIAGDIIVGFPGETDEDFASTRRLLERVPFKNNFIFKYSPRPGTAAIERLPDDVPDDVKRARNNELLAVQADVSARVHEAWIGRTEQVFVERISSRSSKAAGNVELGWEAARVQMSGRTGGDLITVFDLPEGMSPDEVIGHILPVRITGAGPLILRGALLVQAEGDGRESNATLAPA